MVAPIPRHIVLNQENRTSEAKAVSPECFFGTGKPVPFRYQPRSGFCLRSSDFLSSLRDLILLPEPTQD